MTASVSATTSDSLDPQVGAVLRPADNADQQTGKTLEIAGRHIGPGRPTFVIAEIGVNHDGDLHKALELVKIASACGADAVKLQIFRANSLMHPSCELAAYQRERVLETSPIDMLRRYELSRESLRQIVRLTAELNMVPIATPFSPTDVETIAALRLPAVKIASPDLVNLPLLEMATQLCRPMLLSTGAATMDEVRQTARWLDDWFVPYALLHCVSSYPTPASDANLGWVTELDRAFAAPVGYSDHTTHALAGALAVMAGATIVEKHITYDRDARGPDHSASADPAQFERYVRQIREAEALRGTQGKTVLKREQDVRRVSRQSLVLRRTLQTGEPVLASDLTVQRPGMGIPAAECRRVVGQVATRLLQAGTMLEPDMITATQGVAA